MKMDDNVTTIDAFIAAYPKGTQIILHELRKAIREVAPDAGEKIGYGIPTFTLHGNLVHFSAYEHHIGFYPGPAIIAAFAKELMGYETTKGTVRFPIDKPLPLPLIRKMVAYRVEQVRDKKKA
jgi:uncharacterized protein YdhG (YjbR/CyaY superfamily)